MQLKSFALTLVIPLAAGCGSDGGSDGSDAGNVSGDLDAAPGSPDADIPEGYVELITAGWTRGPASEGYRCARLNVTEDMYINAFRSLEPLGTHHAVVSVTDNQDPPEEEFNCNAGTLAHTMLFASGVGTDDLVLPDGVAIKVRAGQQLQLNLHTFNVSEVEISGRSGTLVKLLPAAEVEQEAEVVFGGTTNIVLPSKPEEVQEIEGGCVFEEDATVFALWPHMHQTGVHMQAFHETGGAEDMLLDEPFDFNEQLNYVMDTPVQVSKGERIKVLCGYRNATGSTITFGDSSTQEMCFLGIYRYPATGAGIFDCAEGIL